jgi:hypothetical protein
MVQMPNSVMRMELAGMSARPAMLDLTAIHSDGARGQRNERSGGYYERQ